MKKEEFYQKYANTPLEKRFIPLNFATSGLATLHEIYREVDALEALINPLVVKQQELIKLAEPLLSFPQDSTELVQKMHNISKGKEE